LCAAALASAGAAYAQSESPPDLSGNDPHWIEDKIAQCWAANPQPQGNETISWSGACEGGLISGPGTLTWSQNGRITARDEGTFKEGRLTGRGRIISSDGAIYDGEFPGTGTLTLPDGRRIRAQTVREFSGWTIEALMPETPAP
jgi:MORN repeat